MSKNKSLRLSPGEMRDAACALGRLSGDADEARRQLSHSWNRLDGGWEWYAAEDINGHYGRAMNLLDRMVGVLREMDEALVKTADLIEQADLAAAELFDLSAAGTGAGVAPPLPAPVYAAGLSEADLARLQENQGSRNDCGEYAIAAALDLLFGGNVRGSDVAALADLTWWQHLLSLGFLGDDMRLWPNGPTTPQNQVNIVSAIAHEAGLAVNATATTATTAQLIQYLSQPDTAVLVTIGWDDSNRPTIATSSNPNTIPAEGPLGWGAHSMLLASYDPTHVDKGGNPTPWGFVNSWADGGTELYWMTDADFNQTWDYDIPLIGSNNVVVINNTVAGAPASP